MLDLKFKTTIKKPIDKVWSVVIDEFTEAHRWATGTNSCRPGTEMEEFDRVCDTESGRLMDKITRIDHENYLLEFSVTGLPFFVKSVLVTWRLNHLTNNETEIILGPRIEVIPVIGTILQYPMKSALNKIYPGLVDDLKTYIETGEPSLRKQKEIDGQK